MSVYGEYGGESDLNITFGYSKDHRPDLRQLKLGAVVTQDGIPLAGDVFSGNETDQTWNEDLIPWVTEWLSDGTKKDTFFVGDSALVTKENLRRLKEHGYRFVSRLPNTFGESTIGGAGLQPRDPHRRPGRGGPGTGAQVGVHLRSHHERPDDLSQGDLRGLPRPGQGGVSIPVAESTRAREPGLPQEGGAHRGPRLRHAAGPLVGMMGYLVAALIQKLIREALPKGESLGVEGRKTDTPTAQAVIDMIAHAQVQIFRPPDSPPKRLFLTADPRVHRIMELLKVPADAFLTVRPLNST